MNKEVMEQEAVLTEEGTVRPKKKGFTLAELLIVVAIIAVLVAVAIPVFRGQLQKAELATDLANVRGEYADQVAQAMANGEMNGSGGKFKVSFAKAGLVTHTTVSVKSGSKKVVLKHSKNTDLSGAFSYDADNVQLKIS